MKTDKKISGIKVQKEHHHHIYSDINPQRMSVPQAETLVGSVKDKHSACGRVFSFISIISIWPFTILLHLKYADRQPLV